MKSIDEIVHEAAVDHRINGTDEWQYLAFGRACAHRALQAYETKNDKPKPEVLTLGVCDGVSIATINLGKALAQL